MTSGDTNSSGSGGTGEYLIGRVVQIPRDEEAPVLRVQRVQRIKAAIRAYPSSSMFAWEKAA